MLTLYLIFMSTVLFLRSLHLAWWIKHLKVIINARKFPTLSGHVPIFGHFFLVIRYLYKNENSTIPTAVHFDDVSSNPGGFMYTGHWVSFFTHKLNKNSKNPMVKNKSYVLLTDIFSFVDLITEEFLKRGVTTGTFWLGPVPYFVVCDPEDAKVIYENCLDNGYAYKFASSWLGEGLISCSSLETWKKKRRLLIPSFSQRILNEYVSTFNKKSKELVEKLSVHTDSEFFDPNPEVSFHSMSVLSETMLGKNLSNVPVDAYSDLVSKILKIIVIRTLNVFYHLEFIYRQTKLYKEEKNVCSKIKAVSKFVLDKNTKARHAKKLNDLNNKSFKAYSKTFVNLLLDVRDKGLMDEVDIQDELDTMIAAGYETSSTSMLIILSVLGRYQNVQEKVYQEIVAVLGNSKDIDHINLKQLVYLDAVIKEILRLFPVIMINPRSIDSKIKLGNITTVSGEQIYLNMYAIGRHKSWGADVREFKPERWLNPDEPINPYLFTSFSLGKRTCLGKYYALMSLKTSMAQIVRNFKILAQDGDLKLSFNVTSRPVSGNKIALKRRSQ